MALVMKMDIEKFKEALTTEMGAKLDTLIGAGAKLDLGFYSITVAKDGQHFSTKIAISTTSLMKGTAPKPATTSALTKIDALLDEALAGFSDTQPKDLDLDFGEPAEAEPKAKPKPKAKAKKVTDLPPSGPVKLRLASHLGQEVTGTSSGSTYRAVALSDRLNVAVRVHGTNISIRAEGTPNAYEAGRLSALGFSKATGATGGHWSIHMECAGVPVSRIVGAVLMDLGIEFELQIKNLKEAAL